MCLVSNPMATSRNLGTASALAPHSVECILDARFWHKADVANKPSEVPGLRTTNAKGEIFRL
jgi:hypothetical protein